MTEAELLAAAARHAKAARFSADQYLAKIFTTPNYAYKETEWYKALAALQQLKTLAPPAPPPAPSPEALAPYRSILFMGENPGDAFAAPGYYKVAFTPDPAYDGYARRAVADQLRAAGHGIYVWYVPTEVSATRADDVAARLGASHVLGQCETADQFDATVAHGRKAMVGNLAALRPDQLARVASGERVVVNELYRNCQGNQQPDWKNANAGVPGNCVAVYGDGDCQRMPLSQYVRDGLFVPHRDSVYGPGMRAEDWAALT